MTAARELIFMKPVFHEKIWGGRKLACSWGYEIPSGPIGECWAIAAHPNGDCEVARGTYAGRKLSELWANERDLFGEVPAASGPADQFPLLVKILDAEDDLSVQVHPDDAYATHNENGSLGKKECWYILGCDADTTITVGQRARTPEEFRQMVAEGRWSELLGEVPIHEGDFFQIDPGCIHAIHGGTTILETQQSSDVTYRVYDYDRIQADGTKRELHLNQSIECVDFSQVPPRSGKPYSKVSEGVVVLEENNRYTVSLVEVRDTLTLPSLATFQCVSVIKGAGQAAGIDIARGDHFIVPADFGELVLEGQMTLVVSHVPCA